MKLWPWIPAKKAALHFYTRVCSLRVGWLLCYIAVLWVSPLEVYVSKGKFNTKKWVLRQLFYPKTVNMSFDHFLIPKSQNLKTFWERFFKIFFVFLMMNCKKWTRRSQYIGRRHTKSKRKNELRLKQSSWTEHEIVCKGVLIYACFASKFVFLIWNYQIKINQ